MKRGHVTGHKQERKGHNWLMQTPEYEEAIRKLEAAWQAQQAGQQK